jgi:Glucanosyltransferase
MRQWNFTIINRRNKILYCRRSTILLQRSHQSIRPGLIIGVAYQRSPEDPLVNETQCVYDAALMQTLGVNVIRSIFPAQFARGAYNLAYHVNPSENHDGCMAAFSQAGIYVFLDLDTFTTQIEETDPMWNMTMYTDFTAVIDAFDKYDNMAGFFVANEVETLFRKRFDFRRLQNLVGLMQRHMLKLLREIQRRI